MSKTSKSEDKRDSSKSKSKQELDTPGKIMVAGIPKRENYTDAELEKEFSTFGRVTEVNIIRDKRTSIPRGFAFVTFENPSDSETAIKAMEGKDLGGESAVHCEQAVIGFRKSKTNDDGHGRRSESRGRGGRGPDRGNERGVDRGYGRGADRGRGRGGDRGMMSRGIRGGMYRGRGRFEDGSRRRYPEEEYYEDYYEPEPSYEEFSHRGGGYGGARGPFGQGPSVRGGRRVLLPDPPARGSRGSRFSGQTRGPPQEDYYGDDANGGYEGRAYYSDQGDAYGDGYEDPYSEDVEYPTEYDDREPYARPSRGMPSRGRAEARVQSRRGVETRAPPRHQVEDYDYPSEVVPQRSRQTAGPASVMRRTTLAFSEEIYDEDNSRAVADPTESYNRARGRALPSSATAPPSDSQARLVRVTPGIRSGMAALVRSGVASGRRVALLESDPYAQEDSSIYERAAPQSAAVKVAASATPDYDDDTYDDHYRRRMPSAVSRQSNRPRMALIPSEDLYGTERIQAKPALLGGDSVPSRRYGAERIQPKPALLGGDAVPVRRSAIAGAASRYVDDYAEPSAAQGREVYTETRRPVARRSDGERRIREDPYQRSVTDADGFVSYPISSRAAAESLSSDSYSRKRHLDSYDNLPAGSGLAVPSQLRREYDDYRPTTAVPLKRERIDRGTERNAFDTYSRQESAYRGL